jgi:ElaB/YqjD/DUF883 family membrane-anchored ribosome-binding protein
MLFLAEEQTMNNDPSSRPTSQFGSAQSPTQSKAPEVGSQARSGLAQDVRTKAGEVASKLTEAAQQAGSQAKQAASSLASEANQKAKGLMNQKVSLGAEFASHIADAAKSAADNLDGNAPQIAGLVRDAAEKLEGFSSDLREQTVDDLVRTASDFTRRQPALVFGLASLAGFALFRVLKSNSSSGPDTPQGQRGASERFAAGQFHGT